MKRFFFFLSALLVSLTASAQIRFGYFSYNTLLKSMPEYAAAQRSIDDLRNKYAAEMKRAEQEFNLKYEEFLDVQRELVPSILHKRQTELQDMMDKNIAFKQDAQRLLKQAENDTFAPVKQKLNEAIAKVGREHSYAFVLNTDNESCPYVNPEIGEDATEAIKAAIK